MSTHKQVPENVPTDKPSASRIYDYLLGGYHNFEVDRMVAQKFIQIMPKAPLIMQANRAFMRRVVRFSLERGIDQFLDVGSGIPTVGNVHEIAQEANPSARVVYVDMDPVAVHQSEALLGDNPNATVIQADAREPEVILSHPETRRLLDFSKPITVLITSVLLFVNDDEKAYRMVRVLRDALPSGSYIGISHGTEEGTSEEELEKSYKLYALIGSPLRLRSRDQIERFFDGFELVEPGLVFLPLWRPEGPDDLFFDQPGSAGNLGGVGRKP